MKTGDRIAWATAVVVLDLVLIVIPIAAVFAAYVILARPPWFRDWVRELYRD